jgi:hypothetical protein
MTSLVSRLAARVGNETAKIMLAGAAKKLPSAPLINSSQ